MITILISGNDTGVGKTHVTGLLARQLAAAGSRVRIVKIVETGATASRGDAATASAIAGASATVESLTLFSFKAPLAPLQAAALENRPLRFHTILDAISQLDRSADVMLLEGAGGLAVPLDEDGSDWADLARELPVAATLLIVQDRLGAINQARLLAAYCETKCAPSPVWLLNASTPAASEVRQTNRHALSTGPLPLYDSEQIEAVVALIGDCAFGKAPA
jgi:dethiobiotin synthetase